MPPRRRWPRAPSKTAETACPARTRGRPARSAPSARAGPLRAVDRSPSPGTPRLHRIRAPVWQTRPRARGHVRQVRGPLRSDGSPWPALSFRRIMPMHRPLLHDEPDALYGADVREGVALNGDHVRAFADLDRSSALREAADRRVPARRRLDGFHRCVPTLDEVLHFDRQVAVVLIRADADSHTALASLRRGPRS